MKKIALLVGSMLAACGSGHAALDAGASAGSTASPGASIASSAASGAASAGGPASGGVTATTGASGTNADGTSGGSGMGGSTSSTTGTTGSQCIALDAGLPPSLADAGLDVAIATTLWFSSYAPAEVTVELPPGPFAQAVWTFQAEGGALAECTQRYPNGVCGPAGDYVDRVISNRIVLPGGDGGQELEFDRAITNYGGLTSYQRDISDLAPLLGGATTFRMSIQTGCVDGGYAATASLHLVPAAGPPCGSFRGAQQGIDYLRVPDSADAGFGSAQAVVTLPAAMEDAQLLVFATGHNSQGMSCEEFCAGQPIALSVDGAQVGRAQPEMGANDPTCMAGCDGCGNCQASSVPREGWCPGQPSPPFLFPVGPLAAGPHTVAFESPGSITPGGYWLVSASVVSP